MHVPVLAQEIVELLRIPEGGTYVDATAGGGGHCEAILEALDGKCGIVAIDRDAGAVEKTGKRLNRWHDRCRMLHGNFADIAELLEAEGVEGVDGILMDLGMSSYQLDDAARGFSFMNDGPLDMRMDVSEGVRASDLVNNLDEKDLVMLFRQFGEERMAARIAARVLQERRKSPVLTTSRLANIVGRAKGRGSRSGHPATLVFQALRIAVNRELECLDRGLRGAYSAIKPGGRLAVISYHSLEDRRVKRFFKSHAGQETSLQAGGSEWVGERPRGRLVNRKPVVPTAEERESNVRSRSAKLRVIERME